MLTIGKCCDSFTDRSVEPMSVVSVWWLLTQQDLVLFVAQFDFNPQSLYLLLLVSRRSCVVSREVDCLISPPTVDV